MCSTAWLDVKWVGKLSFKDLHCYPILIWLSIPLYYSTLLFWRFYCRPSWLTSVTPLAICQPDAWTTTFFQDVSFVHWSQHIYNPCTYACTTSFLRSSSLSNNLLKRNYPWFSYNLVEFANTIIDSMLLPYSKSHAAKMPKVGIAGSTCVILCSGREDSVCVAMKTSTSVHWCSLMSVFE